MADKASAVLDQLSKTVRGVASSTESFKSTAEQNNGNMQKILKDVYKVFSSAKKDNAGIVNSLEGVINATETSSRKVDSTNMLLQQSIGIQSQLLGEMRTVSHGMKSMAEAFDRLSRTGGLGSNSNTPNPQNQNAGATPQVPPKPASSAVKPALIGAGVGGVTAAALGATPAAAGTGPAATAIPPSSAAGNPNSTDSAGSRTQATPAGSGASGADPKVQKILAAIRGGESGGRYTAGNDAGKSSASGAYQFIDGTWAGVTKKFKIGQEYARAKDAPPNIQDAVAAAYVQDILNRTNGNVEAVFTEWFTGKPYAKKLEPDQIKANPGLTIEKVVADRMRRYNGAQAGGQQQQRQPQQSLAPQISQREETPTQPRRQEAALTPQRSDSAPAPQAQPQAPSRPSSGAGGGAAQYLASREAGGAGYAGVNASKLNSSFAERLQKGIAAAEAATGSQVRITEGYRDSSIQAQYYANYIGKPVEWPPGSGTMYTPKKRGGIAAPPGQSKHQRGLAVDIADGPARKWLAQHASEFGLSWGGNWSKSDPPHFEMQGGGSDEPAETNTRTAGSRAGSRTADGGGDASMQPQPRQNDPMLKNHPFTQSSMYKQPKVGGVYSMNKGGAMGR